MVKVTLSRMLLITTLICIALAILHAIGFKWSYMFLPAISYYDWVVGNDNRPFVPLTTFGQALPLLIGAGILVAIHAVLFVFLVLFPISLAWQLTAYKEKK